MSDDPRQHARVHGLYAILNLPEASTDPGSRVRLARSLCAGGTRLFQLRAKNSPAEKILSVAEELLAVLRPAGARLILNDRLDLAMAVGADGVHLGQSDLPPVDARKIAPESFLIGLSTHTPDQVRAATRLPVDYLGFGPIFPTASKPDAETPQGIAGLRDVRQLTDLPLVAIGGITVAKTPEVRAAGADAVAMIGALEEASDPEILAAQLGRPAAG